LDAIKIPFESFCEYLKPEYNYSFVLLHHENKNIVDYSEYFNDPNYKELVHILTRKRNTFEEINLNDDNQWSKKPNFRTPLRITETSNSEEYTKLMDYLYKENELTITKPYNFSNFNYLDQENKISKLKLPVNCEGLVVRVFNEDSGKTDILKFQTNSYQFISILSPNNNNIYMSFIELYQNDILKKHLDYFPGNTKITLLENSNEYYDTVGMVDASFKVLTSELFELFRHLYNIKDCSHKNTKYYKILPTEYTVALYKIRGIYFKKKEKYIKSKKNEEKNVINLGLKIFDIYNLLKKNYEIKDLLKLFKARKVLMANYQNDSSEIGLFFKSISDKCDKVSIRMISIFLNKMFTSEPLLNITPKSKEKYIHKMKKKTTYSSSI